jgi:hypothetical protein
MVFTCQAKTMASTGRGLSVDERGKIYKNDGKIKAALG